MQGLLNILKMLWKLAVYIVVIYLVFMVLAWALLGSYPRETWGITKLRLNNAWYTVTGASHEVSKTARDMSNVAQKHLNEANDRYHGKDPYEDYNKSLSNN